MVNYKRVLIGIPSKARSERILKFTAGWLMNQDMFDWKVFVEPHERILYSRVLGKERVVNIQQKNQGLSYAINFMNSYALEHGYDFCLKFDDDSHGFEMYPDNGAIGNLKIIMSDCIEAFDSDDDIAAIRFIHKRYWLYDKKNQQKFSHRNQQLWATTLFKVANTPPLPVEVRNFTDVAHYLYMVKVGKETLTYRNAGISSL